MGSCPVLDRAPWTLWPEPPVAGIHFLDLGLDRPAATAEEYEAIPEKLEAWLADEEGIRRVSTNAAEYFDRYLKPAKVGGQILSAINAVVSHDQGSEACSVSGRATRFTRLPFALFLAAAAILWVLAKGLELTST